VRPTLENDEDAVRVAFTEVLSGRAPEGRGNGLKYVKEVVSEYPINLLFRTGNAELAMAGTHPDFAITATKNKFRGCLVMISY
jgi:hypothetical protein